MPSEMASHIARKIFSKTEQALELEKPMIGVFGSVHRVSVEYPSLHLLQEGEKLAGIDRVDNAANRYDPTAPLVPDKAVIARAGRDNRNENSMASYYECADAMDGELPNFSGSLGENMAELIRFPGRTTLETVIYRPADDSSVRIRLRAVMEIYSADGSSRIRSETYDMTTYEFAEHSLMLDIARSHSLWRRDLRDIHKGLTDRGYRHVNYELRDTNWRHFDRNLDGSACQFGRRRGPRYEEVLPAITTKINVDRLPEDDRFCMYCTESFLKPGHEAVNPPCGVLQHIICTGCILKICEAKGPEEACCAECRGKFFTTREQLDFLVFGVKEGVFRCDPRYTSWENFQRSCADLDKQSAISSETSIVLKNSAALFNIWLSLISDDLADEREPKERRLDFSPEYRTLILVVEKFFREFQGIECTTDCLQQVILHHIRKKFMINWLDGGGDIRGHVPDDEVSQYFVDDDLLFRPAMLEAIERSIERFVRALQTRICSCGQAGDDLGRHYHGDQYFWDAAELNASQQTQDLDDDDSEVVIALEELEAEYSAVVGLQRGFW